MFDAQLYREKTEVQQWKEKGPLRRFIDWLTENELLHDDDLERIEKEVAAEVAESVAFAEAGQWEPVSELTRGVYADSPAETVQ